MENIFKGTKGKWYSHSKEDLHIKSDTGRTVCFDTSRKNWHHDALLISKAPELLEFAQFVAKSMPDGSSLQAKALRLIKSATEL